jgi:hypothetical protein
VSLALQKLLTNPQQVILLLFGQRHAEADDKEVAAGEGQLPVAEELKVPARYRPRQIPVPMRAVPHPLGVGRGSQPIGHQRVQSADVQPRGQKRRVAQCIGACPECGTCSAQKFEGVNIFTASGIMMSSQRGNEYSGAAWDVQYASSTDFGGELPSRIRSRLCDARAALAQMSRALI